MHPRELIETVKNQMPPISTEANSMTMEDLKEVEFWLSASTAKEVFVAGTFNEWRPDAAPLRKDLSNVRWTTRLHVPPGRHEYKFVVDGDWICEPSEHVYRDAPEYVPNEFGTMNRVLDVS